MSNAFFYDLLASIAERGRSVLKIKPWPKDGENRAESLIETCRALVAGRGEASGIALADEILRRYRALDPSDHAAFFRALADEFGPDRKRVMSAIANFGSDPDEAAASEIHYASEPRRHDLFRRLNRAPGGTSALVEMRADLLALMNQNPSLGIVDRDFLHLFSSWFNRGFLVLRRIDWSSPAALLEKIIRYEAVHEIGDWDELRRRIDPADRRCYAFFHPRLIDEPLIFVEVALTVTPPAAIAPLLAEKRPHVTPDKARVATFYSISNCQQGLAGVNFGNFLIKQVVEEIRRELPAIETFITLSPVPGFRAWLETTEDASIATLRNAALSLAAEDDRPTGPSQTARLRAALEPLAACYFLKARRPDGRAIDPVARFHLGNGASLERIDWQGDLSPKGLAESYGIMVNYLYDLDEIERNHESFVNRGQIAASSAVKKLLPGAPSRLRSALPGALTSNA
ncbi:MAG TPA: malonyl-CoA decarboxylase [Roseiarcus sp.]|jgi:malonyl-CoA decarboxylase